MDLLTTSIFVEDILAGEFTCNTGATSVSVSSSSFAELLSDASLSSLESNGFCISNTATASVRVFLVPSLSLIA